MTPPRKKSTSTESAPTAAKTAKPRKKSAAAREAGEESGAAPKRPISPPEMSQELIDFITAIDTYKRTNSRPFPSWGEVLEVLKSLGYERVPEA
jgi:phosphoglycolate phosphatase-like HAD superfamily hydrolase